MEDPERAAELDRILARFGEVQEEYEHLAAIRSRRKPARCCMASDLGIPKLTNRQVSAGAVVNRSASARLSPLDVFHFRHRFFPPKKGFAAACFIHEATWCSSRSSTDPNSTPRVDLPIPIGVTGGSGLISVPRINISFK